MFADMSSFASHHTQIKGRATAHSARYVAGPGVLQLRDPVHWSQRYGPSGLAGVGVGVGRLLGNHHVPRPIPSQVFWRVEACAQS